MPCCTCVFFFTPILISSFVFLKVTEPFVDDLYLFQTDIIGFAHALYHYKCIHGSLVNCPAAKWLVDGVPSEYLSPSDEVEVMNNYDQFLVFWRECVTHLYREYVIEVESDEDED